MRISDWSSDVCSSDLDEAIRIDVDLRQHDALVGIVGGDLFEHGGELLARPAPFGPEIQDDEAGHRRLDAVAPERLDGFLFLRVQAQCGHGMSPRSQRGKLLMGDLDGRCAPRESGSAAGSESGCPYV